DPEYSGDGEGQRLFEEQRVKFDIRRDMKGDRAINVRVIK
ncbi:MAG: cold shock domain-containing protein, partial [Calditrichia bacterium]|nr:cold shock domain-containing protein [Calditrichia bacterium]